MKHILTAPTLVVALALALGGVGFATRSDTINCEHLTVTENGDNSDTGCKDLCPNLEGVQYIIPKGYVVNSDGLCVVPVTPPVVPPVVTPPVTPPVTPVVTAFPKIVLPTFSGK